MKKYYFFDGTAQQGPFTLEELKEKNITNATSVWFDPMPQWKPAGEVDELRSLFASTGTPPPHPLAPKQDDWNTKQFYYTDGTGTQQGPFKLHQLEGKGITAKTAVWYDPLPKWTTADQVPALKNIISQVAATPAQEDWNNKQFYYTDGAGTQQGPFKLHQLEGKGITAKTAVWYDPLPKWTTADQVPALKNIISLVAAAPAQEDWNNKQFYYTDGAGTQQGPFKLHQLEGKGITAKTAVWYDPLPKWTTADQVPALKNIISLVAAAPAQEDWNNKQFYYTDGAGTQQGPFKLHQLEGKGITVKTAVWYDPLPKWTTADQVPALKNIISQVAAAPAQEDWNNKQFYYTDGAGTQQGPFKLHQLEGKGITAKTAVWYDPLPKWTTADQVPALKDILDKAVSAPQTVVEPKHEDWSNKFYFITDGAGTQQGPFKLDQLKEKNITAQTPVWYDPLPKWTTAGEVAGLKDILSQPATA